MQEIECPKCGRQIKGKAELCLFCGTRVAGATGATAGKGRKVPIWAFVVGVILILLCCVLGTQSGALMNMATGFQNPFQATISPTSQAPATETPTRTPTPTSMPAPTYTLAPPQTPTPLATPTGTSAPTLTPTNLLPETGGGAGWPFALWTLGGAAIFTSWMWRLRKQRRKSRDHSFGD